MEGQERNTAQLERIGAAMERRWGSEEESRNGDEEEGSEDGPGESQEGGLVVRLLLVYWFCFVPFLIDFILSVN